MAILRVDNEDSEIRVCQREMFHLLSTGRGGGGGRGGEFVKLNIKPLKKDPPNKGHLSENRTLGSKQLCINLQVRDTSE